MQKVDRIDGKARVGAVNRLRLCAYDDEPSAHGERLQSGFQRRAAGDDVDYRVHTLALREHFDVIREIAIARIDDVIRPHGFRQRELVVADIGGQHARAA